MLNFGRPPVKLKWIAVGVGLVIIIVLLTQFMPSGEPEKDPETVITETIKNTDQATTYEYSIKMSTYIDGKEEITSDVIGERESDTRIHFSGTIFDSKVEFFLIDSTTYYQDQLTGQWTKMDNDDLNQQEIFMQEINPLASLKHKELRETRYVGTEEIDGKKFWVYTAKPVVDNPYMEILWKDFNYKLWISPKDLLLKKALVTGVSKNKSNDKLNLVVQFRNYGKDIEIKPPK